MSAGQDVVLIVGQGGEWRRVIVAIFIVVVGVLGGKESMNGSSEYVGVLLVGRSDAVGTLVRTRLQNLVGKIEEVTWCAGSECAMLEM